MRKLFADSYVLTSEEENKRLELLNQKYEDEKIKVAEKNQKIKEINDLAASEHREKTHSENVAIQALQDEMDRIAVQHMTQNQMEQKVILENMRVQASEISARQAAEVVENSAKTRDKVIKDAEKTRNDKIAEAIRQRDEIGSLNAQEAEAVIAEAKRQYDSTVSTARDKHKEIVSEAKSQAGEHANQVDWETGQIKSKYQVMKDDVVQKMKETWSGITKWWEETKTSADNKVEEIKNTVSRKFEEQKKAVNDKMREIKSDIEDKWNTVEKFFSTINLRSIGKSIIEGLEKGLDDATGGLYSKAKSIAGEIKKTISGALEINSPSKVMIPVGSAVPEGVGVGMDKGKRFVVDAAKNVVGTVKKQMGNMPSVFDFGFQTSHYSIPHNTLADFNGYTQLQSPYNNAPTAKTMFSDRLGREQELNVTVNMTNVLDGKELANGSYAYTTKLQDRDQKRRAEF
ncbi:hypothetical protein IES_06282 [Bacillus cereus BMG1.7]|nr:hypothetical protein IES_06282 [Bacillus cereus BMG1.7]